MRATPPSLLRASDVDPRPRRRVVCDDLRVSRDARLAGEDGKYGRDPKALGEGRMRAQVRAAVKGLLPEPAVRRIRQRRLERAFRRFSRDLKNIDLDKASLIREASLSDLGNPRQQSRDRPISASRTP
jgi:hypothetical protein